MLLRPYEVLVPREQKAACLQKRFDILATEQVHGKEKLWDAVVAGDISFFSDSCCCEGVDVGECQAEDAMQAVKGWREARRQRSVQRPTKLLQARNMATWLRQKELDDRNQRAPWIGGSKDRSRKGLLGGASKKPKSRGQQSKQPNSLLPATKTDPYWEVACTHVQLCPSRVVGQQGAKALQQRAGQMDASESDELDDLARQLDKLNAKCKRVQKQGMSRTHSQFSENYNRSQHIQSLHARAQAYKNLHNL